MSLFEKFVSIVSKDKEARDFFIPFVLPCPFLCLILDRDRFCLSLSFAVRLCSSVTPRQIIGFPVHEWSLSVAGRAAWYRGNLIYVFPGLFTRRPRKGVRGVLTSGRSTAFAGNGGWLRGAEEEAEFVSLEFGCYRFLMGKIVRFRVHIVHIDRVPPSILTPIKSSFPISLFAFYASFINRKYPRFLKEDSPIYRISVKFF